MSRNLIISLLLGILIFSSKAALSAPISEDLNSAVAYAYFQIGEDESDDQSLSLGAFLGQIKEITENHYNVASIKQVLDAQKSGKTLPPRTIILTFEKFDRGFLRDVWPILEENNLPFLLFLNAAKLDTASSDEDSLDPNWDDARTLENSPLSEIGITPYSYTHSANIDNSDIEMDINRAKTLFREKMEIEPLYFSYPFGEFTPDYLDAVSKQGFMAAFTQASGVIGLSTPRNLIPRFTMTDSFADIERFRMTSSALPFPVTGITPMSVFSKANPPSLGFTVSNDIPDQDIKKMNCFASGISDVSIHSTEHRIQIEIPTAFDDGKGRVNCTIPVSVTDGSGDDDNLRWRWLGFQFSFPE
ncbi:MAG: polysaccharide deacetylase family protein [Alphaproteobacteria bacterium]|nr:polysaccharide deacetylase family protein [Alphaproteobacteria bacterium]